MYQDILNNRLINVSAISEEINISKQVLHEFRRYGKGMSRDKQVEVLVFLSKELSELADLTKVRLAKYSKVTEVKESKKSKVTKVRKPDKIKVIKNIDKVEEGDSILGDRITIQDYGELSVEDKGMYIPERDKMGKVWYILK